MTNMWQKRCSNIGKTTLRKKNVELVPHRILSVLHPPIPFASLANEGRFISLEFTFELRDKDRLFLLVEAEVKVDFRVAIWSAILQDVS